MKILKRCLLLLTACLALAAFAPRAQADDDYGYFYDTLQPYGDWVQVDGYGYCWHPNGVDDSWAPYTDGYWAYTDQGWTWVSYEDFGGITYHYGRWTRVEDEGWVWVPGNEWAPAWVSWRSSDDYVGWAPLPPEAHWRVGVGFGGGVDAQFDIGPGFYSFVDVRHFGDPELRQVVVNREQNVTIINRTTNITNITVNNTNVYVGGPRYATIAARSTRPIQTLKLVRQTDAEAVRAAGGKTLAHTQGNQLVVLAPHITGPGTGGHLQPSRVAKTLTNSKVERGWNIVKDPAQREKLRTALKAQSHGTGAARPVSAEEAQLPAPSAGNPVVRKKGTFTGESETGVAQPDGVAAATPKMKGAKGKKGKNSFADGSVQPENPSVPEDIATPKPAKVKKGKTPAAAEGDSFDAGAVPKAGKVKKGKTPPASEGGSFDAGATPKNSADGGANLQPFMGGDEHAVPAAGKKNHKNAGIPDETGGYSEPKAKRLPEDRQIEPRGGSAGFENRGLPAESKAHVVKGEKGPKGDKGDKSGKKSNDDQLPPPQ